mgnify:CR=1 FL=1
MSLPSGSWIDLPATAMNRPIKGSPEKNGVCVVSATEKIYESSEGILPESLLESYAEYYSAELAVKVKRGLTENVLKGKWNGGQYPSDILKDELYI